MSTFTARYHSQCGACDGHISPGDSARRVDDEVIHALCTDDQAPARPVVVCTECWMSKPCWCDP
ncbi:MAG: hypothetical protein L0I24_25565 [Pseudonocardia sp.]|nr:hypothetical protein [Pseudonocardia sp.]